MQVHFINSGHGSDMGVKEVDCQSLKLGQDDAPYAIVSNPYSFSESCRAEFKGDKWVVDLD
jgi:hypothetical protein